jgi:SAM-dependent methyltransferase
MTDTRPFIFDYNSNGSRYSGHRRTDPRIAAHVHAALGPARTVLNVGAATGSYEPADRHVLAVEPSSTMRAQRAPHLAPAIIATAEALPLDDKSVDASMAMVTTHHWADAQKGLLELRRVTRHRILIMTFDPECPGPVLEHSLFSPRRRHRKTPLSSHRPDHGDPGHPHRSPTHPDPAGLYGRFPGSVLWPARSISGPRSPPGPIRLGIPRRRPAAKGGPTTGCRPGFRRMGQKVWPSSNPNNFYRRASPDHCISLIPF